jgi:hypothetical protein
MAMTVMEVSLRKDVVALDPSCSAAGNIEWFSCYGKQFSVLSKN